MSIWSIEIKELERLHEALKEQFPDLDKELGQLIRSDDPNVILLYSRRCLEVIITDLCECELKRPRRTEPLQGIIDKLNKEEKIPSHIVASMHGLNSLSTFGTHPKDFDPEQVKPVLINLDIIIKWYLRYKGFGEEIPKQAVEEPIRDKKAKTKEVERRLIQKYKKSIIRSGIILVVLILIAVLYFTNNPGAGGLSRGLEKSVAVLPFINDSPNDSNQYFINGFMEDVLNHLQTIKDLHPISRTSAEKYRKTTKSIPEIAKELSVNYIIEGDMQRYGNSIRLSVNLFKAPKKELKLWGKTYEKKIDDATDIFSLQSQIAQSIATELEAVITPQEKLLIEKSPTSNLSAYENYILGRNHQDKFTKEDWDIALNYYEKAIEIDPDYADAYISIAAVWMQRADASIVTPEEGTTIAKSNLAKAFKLDSTSAEAYAVLTEFQLSFDWNFKSAEKSIEKAISLNPNSEDVHVCYANLLLVLGHPTEAVEQYELALKLDPMSEGNKTGYGMALYWARRYNEATKIFQETLKINPGNFGALDGLPLALHKVGRYSEELEAWKVEYSTYFKGYANVFDQGYAKGGFTGALNLEADSLLKQSNTKLIELMEIAELYACAGNKKKTLEIMEKDYEVHDPSLPYILTDPVYELVHDEPRFQNLFHKVFLNKP